jgi:hypothetical protein
MLQPFYTSFCRQVADLMESILVLDPVRRKCLCGTCVSADDYDRRILADEVRLILEFSNEVGVRSFTSYHRFQISHLFSLLGVDKPCGCAANHISCAKRGA